VPPVATRLASCQVLLLSLGFSPIQDHQAAPAPGGTGVSAPWVLTRPLLSLTRHHH
jgi:hypothetical protein